MKTAYYSYTGNYSNIMLDNNNLTNFQSSVFQSLLNSMASPNYGSVGIFGSNCKMENAISIKIETN